jgi:hypothetical protein
MSITKGQLNLAAWLSIVNAVISLPFIAMSMFLGNMGGIGPRLLQATLSLIGLGLFIYVLLSLRKLFNSRFQFHDADIYVTLLIWVEVVLVLLTLLSLGSDKMEFGMNILSTVVLIPLGILIIMFGTRVLRLSQDLFGLKKPFAIAQIVTGIFFITVILFMLGIIASAVGDVILGIIFFRAAEEPLSHIESRPAPIE